MVMLVQMKLVVDKCPNGGLCKKYIREMGFRKEISCF
jgi:hypothetical protein